MNILDFTLSSLLRRKGRNTALIVVYTFVVFILASVMFFTHAIKKEAAVVLNSAPEIVVQRIIAGRHDLMPSEYMAKTKDIRGVRSVKGRLWGYYFDPIAGANYTLMVADPANPFAGIDLSKVADGNIIIGSGISRVRLAYEGDVMPFRAHNGNPVYLNIAGILPSESELISADIILISEKDFRALFGISQGRFTDLTLNVINPREVQTVARKITEILPDTSP